MVRGLSGNAILGLQSGGTKEMDTAARSVRHAELGEFLMNRRTHLNPESFDLPSVRPQHRRTPGLRREDVSSIAGISTAYYTWIEQGRPFDISADVLQAIAGALRLNDIETAYLFVLAGKAACLPKPPPTPPWSEEVTQVVISRFEDVPALTLTPWLEVLALNAAARELFEFEAGTNVAWWLLCTNNPRLTLLNADDVTVALVALLRRNRARAHHYAAFGEIIERLLRSSDAFRNLWNGHIVDAPPLIDVEFDRAGYGRIAYRILLLCEPVALSQFVLFMTPRNRPALHFP
jgi:transcriptional regulator with XRE-family HTH domain